MLLHGFELTCPIRFMQIWLTHYSPVLLLVLAKYFTKTSRKKVVETGTQWRSTYSMLVTKTLKHFPERLFCCLDLSLWTALQWLAEYEHTLYLKNFTFSIVLVLHDKVVIIADKFLLRHTYFLNLHSYLFIYDDMTACVFVF